MSWSLNAPTAVPRSKKSFSIVSRKGVPVFIKPGKMYVYTNDGWQVDRTLATLHHKIASCYISQTGKYVVHLPKLTPLLAIHDTKSPPTLLNIPCPAYEPEQKEDAKLQTKIAPDGTSLLVANPFAQVKDVTYIFNGQNKPITDFATLVKQFVISDSGKIAAILLEDNIWVWQQLEEQYRCVGFWTNLNAEQHFPGGFHMAQENPITIFKSLAVFDNPDEGKGACFITAVLPPSKPWDTIYLFNSICNFNYGYQPKFSRQSITLPVTEGKATPRLWWSPCCRILVVAIAKNLVMLTRDLEMIAIIPLIDIFKSDDSEVAWLAWSTNLQFFVVTTYTGLIGAITRHGKSLKHKICHMSPFDDEKSAPLGCYCDSDLGNVFIIYSRTKFRHFTIREQLFEHNIENIISMPFPNRLACKYHKTALELIRNIEKDESIEDFCKLIYFADVFRLFYFKSPLRYEILEVIKSVCDSFLKSGKNDALCFFIIRAALKITNETFPALDDVMKMLSTSSNPRDRLLLRILDEEVSRRDWCIKSIANVKEITFYDNSEEGTAGAATMAPPHHNRDVDVIKVIKFINGLLFKREFDATLDDVDIDLNVILEMLIELGRFDRALHIARHPSIESGVPNVFARVISLHPTNAASLYKTMLMCIELDHNQEDDIRALCLNALLNIMRQRIADTAPNYRDKDEIAVSDLCMAEEALELPIPENINECQDFGVVSALAFCATGFQNASYFFNGRSVMIPSVLRGPTRELFRLLWFIRWRHNAFQESIVKGHPGDAALRLLEFPEFINVEQSRAMIEQMFENDNNLFSPDVYEHYITDKDKDFELDPDFVDFACEFAARLTQKDLTDVSIAVLGFIAREEDIPHSTILLAAVVSHLLPWLRTAIPLAMTGFDMPMVVPNSLLEIEDFSFPRYKPKLTMPSPEEKKKPDVVIQSVEVLDETPISAESMADYNSSDDDEFKPPPMDLPLAKPGPGGDYLSEGEEDLRPKKEKVKKEKSESEKKKKKKSKHKPEVKKVQRDRPRLRLIDVDPDAAVKEKGPPPGQPRLISVTPPAPMVPSGYGPSIPPTPEEMRQNLPGPGFGIPMLGPAMPPYTPSVYMPAQNGQGPAFGPIWDMDPSLFNRNFPKPCPNIPLEKNRNGGYSSQGVQAKPEFNPHTEYVMVSKEKEHEMDTQSVSDFSFSSAGPEYPALDPFPFDDELSRRVERLLNEPYIQETVIRRQRIVRKGANLDDEPTKDF
ncbi:hypothetical protein TVAG_227100 [Trichomonas vaginalis G3]|uniref:Uncharacterized protein n=1 Tax=Trichomonas vaginalis (strain ATCC PRA-98 / G3) TaxID=412133 RepID=A2FFV4_TRIV3|nr:hypothetical protein TVAGG3_0803130 [Trichomonas vaginalis G3]EAX96215.1 hypothetical protein TVAG_227100 [Trichomonas vaginalis G3]KAI5496652.1 hypothetical protein TVAGG3_0803130 [Trichomonas vaginalis G3]|eukprot:XP_001309145.1 hypothetical protein [Trichomonas vaginalis G3]